MIHEKLDILISWTILFGMSKPIVKKLLHTRMRVDDLERTVSFYKTILGLKEVDRKESPRGSKLVFLQTPNSDELIEITYYPDAGSVAVQEDLVHLAFEVDSLDTFKQHLKAHGMSYSDGPTRSSNGSAFAFIDAPGGYEIELIER